MGLCLGKMILGLDLLLPESESASFIPVCRFYSDFERSERFRAEPDENAPDRVMTVANPAVRLLDLNETKAALWSSEIARGMDR